MTKISEYLNSMEHYSKDEAKTFSEIVSKSDFIMLLDYKITAEPNETRYMEVNFKVGLTMDDYEKIALMMIENVKTKFGKNEQQSNPS